MYTPSKLGVMPKQTVTLADLTIVVASSKAIQAWAALAIGSVRAYAEWKKAGT